MTVIESVTGSGEAVRGNVNSFVDNLGKQAQGGGVGDSTSAQPGLKTEGGGGGVGHALGQGGATRDVQNDLENKATADTGREEVQAGLNAFQKK